MFYAKFKSTKKKKYEQSGVFLGGIGSDIDAIKVQGKNIASNCDDVVICKIFKIYTTMDSLAMDAFEYFENFCNSLNKTK
jgi:hypothetical protein